MMAYLVITIHLSTKTEFVEALFIHQDNAENYAEYLRFDNDKFSENIDYVVVVESIPIRDWDEENMKEHFDA